MITSSLAVMMSSLLHVAMEMSQAEICPEGLVLVKEIAARVKQDGGGALIADYGEEGVRKHTLRVSTCSD